MQPSYVQCFLKLVIECVQSVMQTQINRNKQRSSEELGVCKGHMA